MNSAFRRALETSLEKLGAAGSRKGAEQVILGVKAAEGTTGPRYFIQGQGDREFLQMNSNSYLGLSFHPAVIEAEENGAKSFGTGPGGVRFISGTFETHVLLERRLAMFHRREAAMAMSAAYATVMGVLPQLITEHTVVISDELNHNCIINGIRLARPGAKAVYRHCDLKHLQAVLKEHGGFWKRAVVVTDGIFSMRGDHAPLGEIVEQCSLVGKTFEEGIITVVDDSHGVAAFGETGRGTEEYTGAQADVLIGTLGKAFGVNGGYVAGDAVLVSYLRETAPFYIYSNPITPSEAAAALKAVEIVDSPEGKKRLSRLRTLTRRLREGIGALGFETVPGEHPIVPVLVRDTESTERIVAHLFERGILATGIRYPVVPRGAEEIRFQVSANHTEQDIDYVLRILEDAGAASVGQ